MKKVKEEKIFDDLKRYYRAIKWCIKIAWTTSRYYTCVRVIASILLPLITIVITYISKHIIDLLVDFSGVRIKSRITTLIFMLLLVTLLRKIIQTLNQYCNNMHGEMLNSRISMMIMDKSIDCDLEYFDNPGFNDELMLVNRDAHSLSNILWNIISFGSALVSGICVFVVVCKMRFLYGIMILLSALPTAYGSAKYTRSLYTMSVEQINRQRQMNYTQNIASDKYYAKEIRLLDMGNWLKERYTNIWRHLLEERRRINRKKTILLSIFECLPEILIAIISIDIASKILNGLATVGDYSLFVGLTAQLSNSLFASVNSAMEIYGNRLKLDRIMMLYKYENHIDDNGYLPIEEINSVSFENVCFSYPGTSYMTLKNVSISIKRGERIALVGENGSGKSTLFKLLLRLYDPDSGVICVNGVDIKKYKLSELRLKFSVYFQEMLNYGFSIRDNFIVTDMSQSANDETIGNALDKVCFKELLNYSPKHCDANLMRYFDSDGIELSGGQFQRLALARAFYRKHSLLILDEPSSNLDSKIERKIFEYLKEKAKDSIVIFSSHEESYIRAADRIILLDKGKVIGDGTHDNLIKNNTKYIELFKGVE